MKAKDSSSNEMRADYDFSRGVRGKYYKRLLKEGESARRLTTRSGGRRRL